MFAKLKQNLLFFTVLIAMAFLLYYRAMDFYFFQDDFDWLYQAGRFVHAPALILTFRMSNFFTPLINAYFYLSYQLFGLNPYYFHLMNILLHGINSFLVFLLMKNLGSKKFFAFLAAVIFLVARYPVEAVVWISAATILIFSFFLLLCGLFWIAFLRTKKIGYYIASFFLLIILFMTKEWAILSLPFLAVVTALYQLNDKAMPNKKILLYGIPILLANIAYAIFEVIIQSKSILIDSRYFEIGWFGIKHMIIDSALIFLPLINTSGQWPWIFLALGILCMIFVSILFILKKSRAAAIWYCWILVSFIPTSFFVFWPSVSRYGYLAAIGLAGLTIVLLQAFWEYKYLRFAMVACISVWIFFNIYFIQQNINIAYRNASHDTKTLVSDLGKIIDKIENKDIFFVNNYFFQPFLLPKVAELYFHKNLGKINVPPPGQFCPADQSCLYWDESLGRLIYNDK